MSQFGRGDNSIMKPLSQRKSTASDPDDIVSSAQRIFQHFEFAGVNGVSGTGSTSIR